MNQAISTVLSSVMTAVRDAGLFRSSCTLQAPTGSLTASGAPSGTFANVTGLVNIKCMNAPISPSRLQATEVKDLAEIMSLNIRHVLLDGYFPTIPVMGTDSGWRAVVTDNDDLGDPVITINYDLLGAEPSSQGIMTRLHLRTANV